MAREWSVGLRLGAKTVVLGPVDTTDTLGLRVFY